MTRAILSASSSYKPVARSSVPVPEATDTKVTRSPVSRSSTRSGRPANVAGDDDDSSQGIRRVQVEPVQPGARPGVEGVLVERRVQVEVDGSRVRR